MRTKSAVVLEWVQPAHWSTAEPAMYTVLMQSSTGKTKLFQWLRENTLRVEGIEIGNIYTFTISSSNTEPDQATVSISFIGEPSAPTELKENVAERGLQTLVLEWTASEDFGGDDFVTYSVYQSTGGSQYRLVASGLEETRTQINNMYANTHYRFKVLAANSFMQGQFSQEVRVWFLRKPDPPTDLYEIDRSTETLTLGFSAPVFKGGDSQVRYTCQLNDEKPSEPLTEQQCTVAGLVLGLNYTVTVAAINSYSVGEPSEPLIFEFLAKPDPPTALREELDMRTNQSLVLVWDAPEVKGGSDLLLYSVFMQIDGGKLRTLQIEHRERQLLVEYLVPGTIYTFQVSVRNDYTESDLSEPLSVDFKWIPEVPTGLKEFFAKRTPSTAVFEWTPLAKADEWSALRLYINSTCDRFSCEPSHEIFDIHSNSTIVEKLVMGTLYMVQIRAENSFRPSEWSAPQPFIFYSEPSLPRNITETKRDDDTLQIEWLVPADHGGDPQPLVYNAWLYQKMRDGTVKELLSEDGLTEQKFTARSLEVGRAYTVLIQAQNAFTQSGKEPFDFVFLQQPHAPSELQEDFRGHTDNSIVLVWEEPSFKGGQLNVNYTLEERIAGEWLKIQSDLTSTNATVSGLEPDSTYEFRVRSENNFTESVPSLVFSTTFAVKKDAMFNLTEVERSVSSVVLRWNEPPILSDSEIKYYQVSLKNMNVTNSTFKTVARDWRRQQITISGLALSTFYSFQIEAIDQFKRSVSSVPLQLQLLEAPSAPFALVEDLSRRSEYSMVLSWQSPMHFGGAGQVDYEISVRDTFGQQRYYETDANQFKIPDMFVSETYLIKVRARNSYTASEWSEPFSLVFLKAPDSPQNIREEMSLRSSDSVLIRWDPPEDFGGALDVTYNIYLQSGPDEEINLLQDNLTYLQVRVYGLSAGQFYTVIIRTKNDYAESKSAIFTSLFTTRPSEPVNLRENISRRTNSSIELVWDSPVNTGGSPTLNYTVVLFDSLREQVTVLRDHVQTNSAVITDLVIGSSYEFRVRAVYFELESAYSLGYTVSLVGKPNQPTAVREVALERGSNSVLLEWTAPSWTGLVQGGNISYIVQVFSKDLLISEINSQTTQVRVPGLQNDNYYRFVVLTNNQVALSDPSEPIDVHFLSKPFAPSSLTEDQDQRTQTSAVLTWVQPQNTDGFESYTVYWLVNDAFEVFLSGVTEERCLIDNLVPGQQLAFKVRAVNSKQNDTNGEIYEFTFLISPSPVENVRVVSRSADQIEIQWDEPSDFGGDSSIFYTVTYSDESVGPLEETGLNQTRLNLTGLTVGSYVTVSIIAQNQFNTSWANQINFLYLITPSEPLNLHEVISSRSNSSLELEWNLPLESGGGNLSYTVYMTQCSFTGAPVILLLSMEETQETRLVWSGLQIGNCYRFDVTARNDFAESAVSEGVLLQFMAQPSAPTSLTENTYLRTATSLTVEWSAPEDIGGALNITYFATLSLNGTVLMTIETEEYSAIFTDLIATNLYTVQVVADNGYLPSEPTDPVEILLLGEPTMPTDLGIEFNGANLDLSWQIESDGGFPITNLTLLAETPKQKWAIITPMCDYDQMVQNQTCSLPLFKLKTWPLELKYRDDFCVKLRATNQWGSSNFTEPVCFSKVILQEPNPPQNVTELRRNRTATTLGLKWDPPVWRGGSPSLDLEYLVLIQSDTRKNKFDLIASGIFDTEYVVTNLTAGETYTFAVLARNAIGDSALSDPLTLWCSWVPSTPLNITASRTPIQTRVNISWTPPETDNAAEIKGYRISVVNPKFNSSVDVTMRCLSDEMVIWEQQCIVEMRFFTDSFAPKISRGFAMTDEDPFCVQVQAVNNWGPSDAVAPICFPGVIMIEPSTPTNLEEVLSFRSENTLGLQWQRPHTGGSENVSYSLWLRKENGLLLLRGNVLKEEAKIGGFEVGRNYTFVVRAHNAMGASSFSQPLTLTGAWLPMPPQQIDIKNVEGNNIQIEWNKVRNMGSKITNSTIFVNDADGNLVDAWSSCQWTENYRVCTLSQRVLYYAPFNMTMPEENLCVRVSVTNQYGSSELSAEVCEIVHISQVPTAPSDIKNRLEITNAHRIGVEWEESYSFNPILAYLVYSDLGGTEWHLLDGELSEPRFKSHQCSGLYPYADVVVGVRSTAKNFIGESLPSSILYITMTDGQSDRSLEVISAGRQKVTVSWAHLLSQPDVVRTYDLLVVQNGETLAWKGLTGTSISVSLGYGPAELRVYGVFNALQGCSCEQPAGQFVELAISTPTEFIVPFEVPEAPFNVTSQFRGNDSIIVIWEAGDNGGLPTHYEVQARNTSGNLTEFVLVGVSNTTDLVFKPANLTELFEFRVRAVNSEGSSEFTEPVQKDQVTQVVFKSGSAHGFFAEEEDKSSQLVAVACAISVVLILFASILCARTIKRKWQVGPETSSRGAVDASCRDLKDVSSQRVELGATVDEQI